MKTLNPINSLYITCPFCQINSFLQKQYGDDIYFLSSTATVLNYTESEVIAITSFLKKKNIKNVYLVTEISCNFLEEAITNKKEFGLNCEKELRFLMNNLNKSFDTDTPLAIKKEFLAKTNIKNQLLNLYNDKLFKKEIDEIGLKIHGLITNKSIPVLTSYNNSECP